MNLQTKMPTTADEFLRWNEGREGKWEFVDGRVVDMMVRVTKRHAVLASRLVFQLMQSLKFPPFTVGTADFGARTTKSVRYPDVLVDSVEGSGSDLAASAPVFVAEILSPSTMAIDFRDKAYEYQTIETLRHHLILAQHEPCGWLWSRVGGGWIGPQLFADADAKIPLDDLSVTINFHLLYEGLLPRDQN